MYEKLVKMSTNNDFWKGNLLDHSYHQKYYEPIGIKLWMQTNTTTHQQINFIGKLEECGDLTMFFITEKQQKTILNLSLDSLNLTE